jgi:hypothetical protein
MGIEDEIRKRLGGGDVELQQMQEFITSEVGRSLAAALGVSLKPLDASLSALDSSIFNLASSIDCLGDYGWATNSSGAPMAAQSEAVKLISGGNIEKANAVLSEGWETLADRVTGQVASLHYGDDALWQIAIGRGQLVAKAMRHHESGSYEASILILLMQIEGIVMDVTSTSALERGKYFFQTKRGTSATDDETVVGIEGALNNVRDWFCGPILSTQFGGNLSRPGLAHGRQLDFGTRENSARCIALLAGVVEFARPLAEQMAKQRNDERLAIHAGSEEVDKYGIRKDRRGFTDARSRLKLLCAAQSGFRSVHGRFANDSEHRKLNVHGAELVIETSQGSRWSGYTTSESGLIFGLAESGTEFRYFEGKSVPPAPDSAEWFEQTPNWSGDVF